MKSIYQNLLDLSDKTLKQFADEAKEGFVTFSLGSLVPVSSMPNETAQLFMQVFSQLPLKIIWKWEGAVPIKVPSNVLMTDWVPQQDLLGTSIWQTV